MNDNAFLNTGIDNLFGDAGGNPNEYEIMVNLDDVEIEAQVREEFEDEGNDLASLGKSLRKRQLQAIVIRPNREGRDKPYLLVAGERRMRAARLEGLPQLRARVVEMDDQEAEDMQLAENIHRDGIGLQPVSAPGQSLPHKISEQFTRTFGALKTLAGKNARKRTLNFFLRRDAVFSHSYNQN